MTDPTGDADGENVDDSSAVPSRGLGPGMPRWVKVSGLVVGALILLLVVLALTGVLGGQHGPGRHMPGGNTPVQHGP